LRRFPADFRDQPRVGGFKTKTREFEMIRMFAASLVALAVVAPTFAQEEKQPPGGEREGRGKGRQRGGFGGAQGPGGFGGGMMMMGGGISGSYVSLLEMKEVQEDLKLTADEKGNIPLIKEEFSEGDKKLFEGFQPGSGGEGFREKMAARRAEIEKQLQEVLGDKYTRFRQIKLQLDGLYAALTTDKVVQEALGITDDQKTKLQEAFRGDRGGQGAPGGGTQFKMSREDWQDEAKMKQFAEEMKKRGEERMKKVAEEAEKVLTPDQKKKWEELIGPKVTYTRPAPKMDGMRFGGAGGRGERGEGGRGKRGRPEGGGEKPPL
jgi:hypothetical protein